MSDVLIRCENASKRFCRDLRKSLWYGVKDIARDVMFDRNGPLPEGSADVKLRPDEFWANKDISFEVKRGECLGLIGHNGAGKTTLLKMLNGLIKPDTGRIEMRGKIGALIALGAGFNPILTGRENIFVNGAILGMSKRQIAECLEEIVDFAELADLIDTPVRNYSSGMLVRLGFAVASTFRTDVLMIDEVLAVGDVRFRIRCYNKIREILPNTAVVLVSHNMNDIIRVSTSVIVVSGGVCQYSGSIDRGIRIYHSLSRETLQPSLEVHSDRRISNVRLNKFVFETQQLSTSLDIEMLIECETAMSDHRLRIVFFDEQDYPVAEWDSLLGGLIYSLTEGANSIRAHVRNIRLRSGIYRVAVVVADVKNVGYAIAIDRGLSLEITNAISSGAAYKIQN